jgi:predicted O-methyltransferase YrrM
MISIIVPTMWRYEPFLNFAHYLVRMDVVTELIIINNDATKTPQHNVLKHPKVRILDFGQNIYVNPAWNFGVAAAREDIVCILNDDLQFDLKLLYKIVDFIKPDMGAIGLMTGDINHGQIPVTTGEIEFVPFTNQNCIGFGELMFIHKNAWVNIPDGMNIGMGDVFIFERCLYHSLQNYFIANMFHYHYGNATTKEEPMESANRRIQEEAAIYNAVKATWFNKMTHFYQNIEGWFSEQDAQIYSFAVNRTNSYAHFVEIGSYKGRSAAYAAVEIANSGKNIKFNCIDIWQPNLMYEDLNFEAFKHNMQPVEKYYTAIKMDSVMASIKYFDNSLDFVFIDADHSYESVKRDIQTWWPKVKHKGMIGGHDEMHEPVRRAVLEVLGEYETLGNCWYIIKDA